MLYGVQIPTLLMSGKYLYLDVDLWNSAPGATLMSQKFDFVASKAYDQAEDCLQKR